MWEVGFAMALDCPTIIVSQTPIRDLPFDLRDMQSLQYDRHNLFDSLSQPLQRLVRNTLLHARSPRREPPAPEPALVTEFRSEIANLRNIVAQLVPNLKQPAPPTAASASHLRDELANLQGAWLNTESNSHAYAKLVGDDLIVPYCFGGNAELNGVYYAWRKTGPYWFARYAWPEAPDLSGFTFLITESPDLLRGAWWSDEDGYRDPNVPPDLQGISSTWHRLPKTTCPPTGYL